MPSVLDDKVTVGLIFNEVFSFSVESLIAVDVSVDKSLTATENPNVAAMLGVELPSKGLEFRGFAAMPRLPA